MDDTQKGDRARLLHDLSETPGWNELRRIYEEQLARYTRTVTGDLLRTGNIDQRDIDRNRGYFEAWRNILAQPELSEKRFEEALRKKGTT